MAIRSTQVSEAEVGPLTLIATRLDALHGAERVFAELYADSESAFWLDSARGGERARFSFIGDASGPLGAAITYEIAAGEVRVSRAGEVEVLRESIFDYLDRELRRLQLPPNDLPFEFDCGFVGYFGYELKAECDGDQAHQTATPDAAFIFADRILAFDHQEQHTYLLCAVEADRVGAARSWIDETVDRLNSLSEDPGIGAGRGPDGAGPIEFRLARPRERYLEEIALCTQRLFEGQTYEVCLTNRIFAAAPALDPLALYLSLRALNPAPFAAYLRGGGVAVLSSSPERFLRVDREGWVEARPIKGTIRRGESAAEDALLAEELRSGAKSRAENTTIVDLLRNDLGIVCEYGTIEVAQLMEVETYETVHQLVSAVRGRLRDRVGATECVRACFPPGSMTGAPKRATMAIIDELEGEGRGVYSGAIGYLGLGGGADLSVAIRMVVIAGGSASIGTGGAIVLGSDPEEEFEEILLKAMAPLRAIDPRVDILHLPRGNPVSAAAQPPDR
ncbi:MAG: anthranilate synthase component I family protein [Solirubrobacterales bacterium]